MNKRQPSKSSFLLSLAGALALGTYVQAQTVAPPNATSQVGISATDPYALAGTSSGAFTLTLPEPTTTNLTVNLTIGGTASNGVDYVSITNSVVIPAGYMAVDIVVDPIVDTAKRGNKTVVLTLQNGGNVTFPVGKSAVVTIIDDIFNIPPPTIALVSPTNGSVFGNDNPIQFEADATAAGDSVQYVSFFLGDTLLGRATNSPYSITWTNPVVGVYEAFARAVDQVGHSTLSAPVRLTVTNDAPWVKLTSPTNGENFTARSPIALTANTGASAAYVTFFANAKNLGSVTNPGPYTITWTNATAGYYMLRATATDAKGATTASAPVYISVSRSTAPPAGH